MCGGDQTSEVMPSSTGKSSSRLSRWRISTSLFTLVSGRSTDRCSLARITADLARLRFIQGVMCASTFPLSSLFRAEPNPAALHDVPLERGRRRRGTPSPGSSTVSRRISLLLAFISSDGPCRSWRTITQVECPRSGDLVSSLSFLSDLEARADSSPTFTSVRRR